MEIKQHGFSGLQAQSSFGHFWTAFLSIDLCASFILQMAESSGNA